MTMTRTHTSTSAFGVSGRESHDSRPFYGRRMFENDSSKKTDDILYDGDYAWANQVYLGSSEHMGEIPSNSVGLAFTSPPYNIGKEYDDDLDMDDYMRLIRRVAKEVHRVLVPGGRYVVNVANVGRKPYIPLTSYYYEAHQKIGFLPMGEIIWRKAMGASGSCAWGSWKSAKNPRLRDVHEYLLVFAKGLYGRPDKLTSTMDKDQFMSSTLSVWDIAPASAKRVGHPAPFPVALAERVINLYSFQEDVVLDPFAGAGTTMVAAHKLGRKWIGYETVPEYVSLSCERIAKLV